ncbi:ribosome maturation factor RimM [Arthrobacter sp. APC 3897]|jgi:16S rRNA processing protein RimM|uniref:ribosome maturation factor RimM n=1 Tax=Arthrobacter sp. APC 3897 TaxID=3035204 RepID=UPI0025B2ED3A|nr:ribosome maturation factor RimM [Arthrobacter sp. APC 3897]MDN3482298.1 ribosome maturation factor RimM [Arthrobacter sp. APC 3897]
MQLQVARIGKPHGIRGEVTVQVLTDAPEDRFVPGTELTVEPASKGPLTVLSARWNKDILLLGFEEVVDRNGAEELRGAMLSVDTDELDDEDDDEGWYEHELVGLKARIGGDVVGTVSGLRTLTVQDLLVIDDNEGREVFVPFVEAIVPEVNVEDGYVLLTPPEGLFELNLPEDKQDKQSKPAKENAGRDADAQNEAGR